MFEKYGASDYSADEHNDRDQLYKKSLQPLDSAYKNIFLNLPFAVILIDDAGIVLDLSKNAETIFGMCRNELIGFPFPTDDEKFFSCILSKLKNADMEKRTICEKMQISCKNNCSYFLSISCNPVCEKRIDQSAYTLLLSSEDNNPKIFKNDNEDDFESPEKQESKFFDEKKRVNDALAVSESRFRTIFETAADAVFMKNTKLKYTLVNNSFEKFFKKRRDEFIGKTAHEVFGDSSSGKIQNVDERVLNGEVVEIEDAVKIEGIIKAFHVIKVPLKGKDGNIIGLCGIARDISEFKRMQAVLTENRKMEALDTLSGGIAHEFNNILSIILGNAEMALEDVEDNTSPHTCISEIMTAGTRASDLVKQLLSFSSITEGRFREVSVADLIKRYVDLYKVSLPKGVNINFEAGAGDYVVCGDANDIQNIVFHLISNAVNAMEGRGGSIRVRADNVEKAPCGEQAEHGFVEIVFKDSGCGMPKNVMDRIFDPFFTTMEVGKGMGMGLSVVLGIVKRHHGYIDVESNPGKGSIFKVYLPRILSYKGSETKTQGVATMGNESILLVDDEPSVAKMVAVMLEKLGYGVTALTDAGEALKIFKKSPSRYDLVITDLTMPEMNGLELAVSLIKISPDIPIIIASGYGERISEKKIGKTGIRSFITKPFSRRTLAGKIRELLDSPE